MPEDVPHVFNRFYQSKNNQKAEGGLGIGLALSMEFVNLMNGKMWVKSQINEKNSGSTFAVQIPKKEVLTMVSTADELAINGTFVPPVSLSLNTISNTSVTHQHTILLVEDNADLREYVSFLLSPFYNVVMAKNGKEGLERLTDNRRTLRLTDARSSLDGGRTFVPHLTENETLVNRQPSSKASVNRQPSLILSDVMMPIMDGFEFLKTVKAEAAYRNIPFIMLTARVELKDKLKALRIGVDDYLMKPFDEVELLTRIENLLANYEERKNFVIESPNTNETAVEEHTITPKEQLWLEELEQLVLKEIDNSIFSIDYLIDQLNINRNTFYNKTKALTGLSPNQYIRTIRLQMAKELLTTTDLSIKEIATKVGFKKTDYFSRLFKKEYGKSPSAYLK
jgi:CheY-like chemotaxis protein